MTAATDPDLVDRARKHFGLTDDPSECGYILPDGSLLDLSGRHWDGSYVRRDDRNVPHSGRDFFAGARLVDHRDLGDLVDGGGTEAMLAFMAATGAVRVKPGQGFTVMTPLTPRQAAAMCLCAAHYGGDVEVDAYDAEGEVVASCHFDVMRPGPLVAFLSGAGLLEQPPPGVPGP